MENINNKSNSAAGAIQVEANLQYQLTRIFAIFTRKM